MIFLPGVSTAEKVSDVSGRGVGMDVVKTNLDRLGGKIEIDSAPGRGSRFRIKLPLTLAIIPSLLVSDGGQRFAIPQVSVGELIRIPAAQIAQRTDRVGDALVLNVRDRLVPLLYLADALGVPRPQTSSRALNVVLVDTGAFEYGLVVEELHDTVEIVVKPLGRHLKGLHDYAGATILGDGRVAVILDVAGLAARAGLSAGTAESVSRQESPRERSGGRAARAAAVPQRPRRELRRPHRAGVPHRARAPRADRISGRPPHHAVLRREPAAGQPAAIPPPWANLTPEQQWVVIVFERHGPSTGTAGGRAAGHGGSGAARSIR